jgi:LuxR family transcriptional regulator, maltose regulon positive regulatory protein
MLYNGFMATAILATKLYIPQPRPGVVTRPRLIDRLNKGLAMGCKLTLISASAGFGKTTLVSSWISVLNSASFPNGRNEGVRLAWLSLDEGDNDPVHFFSYVIAALQTIQVGIGEELLRILDSPQQPQPEAIWTALLNEVSVIPDHLLLILDDYHSIDSQPVDQFLTFLVEHQPPHMHLVIATREDPPLPLSKYRARGQLIELRAADLRFTPVEAAEFLNQVMGLYLTAQDIATLETRTEGWIAGLQLAALSMQGRDDIAGFIQTFTGSHRFVLDYLVEEVLNRQPEHIRSFLLKTAILDKLCAPLCNAVTEQGDGKEMLDVLENSNLFLIPLDDQRHWYRYHHLFAEVLQTHLLEALPDRVAALHLRASEWFERNGIRSDAIRHALEAKDFERAAGLIELAGPEAEYRNIPQATWLGWVKRLPEELIRARPVLNVWYAYILLGIGELEAAQSRFREAEQCLESEDINRNRRIIVVDQEQFKSLPATVAVGRAYIAQALGNIPDTVRYANQVLELMPEGEHFRREQASMLLGMSYWASGNLEAADRVFADYTMKLRKAGNIPDAIGTSVVLADIRLALGRLQQAIVTTEHLLQFVMDQGDPIPPDTADLHRELSALYLEQGALDVAEHHLQRSRELLEKAQLPVLRYRLCIDQARLKKTEDDPEGALALLDEAEHLYIRSPLPDFCPVAAMKARIWVTQGRLTQAVEWTHEKSLSPDDELSYLHEFEHITLARILIAQYQNDRRAGSIHAAIQLLTRLLQAAEGCSRLGSVTEILVLQALAFQAQGNVKPALVPLERALTLAEPEGYVRIFVDEGEAMLSLILDLRSSNEKSVLKGAHPLFDYMDKLLSAFQHPAGTASKSRTKSLAPPRFGGSRLESEMIEPLSEHELEVLRLLRSELSGPEIASERMVSLSTIRTHTQHIYAKLGVNNRRAAVRRAEELGLL